MLTESYFDTLCLLAASVDDRVTQDGCTGALCVDLPSGLEVCATPGFDGGSLPWGVYASPGIVADFGEIEVNWSGDLREDLATYRRHLDAILADVARKEWEHNHVRWSDGLEPLPVDLQSIDAGEVVESILTIYADTVGDEAINIDPCRHLLAGICGDVACMLGHPDTADGLLTAAIAVIASER